MKLLALGLGIAGALLGAVLVARAARPSPSPPPPAPPPATPGVDCQSPDQPVDVPPPSARAVRYHRSGNVIWAVQQILGVAIPALLLFSGLSARIRSGAQRVARGRFYPTLVVYLRDAVRAALRAWSCPSPITSATCASTPTGSPTSGWASGGSTSSRGWR